MAAKLQAAEVVVVLDSDSGEDAGGGDSRGNDGDTKSGRQSVDEMEIAPFVRIVYNMLEGKDETKTKSLMRWSSTGASFIVTDPILFADQLLPIYFRHKNLNSFCHQLTDHVTSLSLSPKIDTLMQLITICSADREHGHPHLITCIIQLDSPRNGIMDVEVHGF